MSVRSQKLYNLMKGKTNLELPEEDENLFEQLIRYAYTGEVELSPTESYEFLQLSIKYGFDGILEGLLSDSASLNDETIVKLYIDWKNYQSVKASLKKEIELRAFEIFPTQLIFYFNEKDLQEIVKDWELCIDEKELFVGLIQWSQYQIEKGIEAPLKNIIKHVRFGIMTIHELTYVVKPTKMIEDHDLQNFIKATDVSSILYKPRSVNYYKLTAQYPKVFAHDNDSKTIIRMEGSEWTQSLVSGPNISRELFVEFKIEKINYRDHSGIVIGISDDLKKAYSSIIGYGMSGYKYNVTGVRTLYSNANDKIGMWIQPGKSVSFYKNSDLISKEPLPPDMNTIYPVCYLYYAGDSVTIRVEIKNPYA